MGHSSEDYVRGLNPLHLSCLKHFQRAWHFDKDFNVDRLS